MLQAGLNFSKKKLLHKLRKKQEAIGWNYQEPSLPVISHTDFSSLEVVLPKMEEFVLCERHYKACTARQVAALARIMPNMKRLRLGMGNDGFRVLCESWKGLEALIIQPCNVNDSEISGVVSTLNTRLANLMELSNLRYFAVGHVRPTWHFNTEVVVAHENQNDLIDEFSERILNEALQPFDTSFPYCSITQFDEKDGEWPKHHRITTRAISPNQNVDNMEVSDDED